jgi:hypothetical protein
MTFDHVFGIGIIAVVVWAIIHISVAPGFWPDRLEHVRERIMYGNLMVLAGLFICSMLVFAIHLLTT